MDFVEIFNISLDLSAIYFAQFTGYRASFVYSCYGCYSILKCCNLFSGVKLSIRSFCFICHTFIGGLCSCNIYFQFCTSIVSCLPLTLISNYVLAVLHDVLTSSLSLALSVQERVFVNFVIEKYIGRVGYLSSGHSRPFSMSFL